MPIRREHRFFYPIDWPQLSAVIRFRRAGGRCEGCGRPHGETVWHLGDGRWWDTQAGFWRDGEGKVICLAVDVDDVLGSVRTTRVILATGHRNHDTADNRAANLMAVCQRCHMIHDRPEHRRRRWRTLFRRKASGDLFGGPYGWHCCRHGSGHDQEVAGSKAHTRDAALNCQKASFVAQSCLKGSALSGTAMAPDRKKAALKERPEV